MKFSKGVLLVVLSLVLAACGGGGDDNEGSDNNESGGGGASLPQSISSSSPAGGTITVGYPEGWAAQESFGSVMIASTQELLASETAMSTAPSEGTIGQVMFLGSSEEANFAAMGLAEDASLSDILNMFGQNIAQSQQGVEMGEAEEFNAGDDDAAIMTGSGSQGGEAADVAVVLVQEDAGYVLISFVSAQGQIGDYTDEIRSIAGSVSYDAGEATPETTPAG